MYHPLPVDDNQAIVLKLWTCFTSRPSHRPRTVGTRLTSSISFSLSVSDNQHYFRFYIGQTWNTPWCSQLWWWPPPPSPSVLGKGRMGRTSAVSPTSKWSSWPGRAQPLLLQEPVQVRRLPGGAHLRLAHHLARGAAWRARQGEDLGGEKRVDQ